MISLLVLMPVTAFGLGTWQVQRLEWKRTLIAKLQERLTLPPAALPANIRPDAAGEYEYRRVFVKGKFRHDQEMLVGPRTRDGQDGYLVYTPFERENGGSKILINRGWIEKAKKNQASRKPDTLPCGIVTLEGIIREPQVKPGLMFDNVPDKNQWYFANINEMASWTGSQPFYLEELVPPDLKPSDLQGLYVSWQHQGNPIGYLPNVNLRNAHLSYVLTWYGLALGSSVMLWMFIRKGRANPKSFTAGKVQHARKFT